MFLSMKDVKMFLSLLELLHAFMYDHVCCTCA